MRHQDPEHVVRLIVAGARDEMRRLIARGLNSNLRVRRRALLHWAAQFGRVDIAQLLLDNGAAVNCKDEQGFTPLHVAVGENRIRFARLLIRQGAKLHARARDNSGGQPVHTAAAYGHLGMVKLLHASGADLNAKDGDGRTPLHFARRYGHTAVADFIRTASRLPTRVRGIRLPLR